MLRTRSLVLPLLGMLLPAAAAAQAAPERAAFVTVLGNDTLAVERFSRQGNELRAEVLVRAPRTTLRVHRMQLGADGRPHTMQTTTHDPAAGPASPALSREVLHFGADSLRIETVSGQTPGVVALEGGRDVLPFIDLVHWPFELMLQRAHATREDSLVIPLLAGRRTMPFAMRRVGPGEYTVTHPTRGTMRTRVDEQGRLLHLDAAGTTRAVRVTRVDEVDLPALARDFAARDARGQAFGSLSGRGETTAAIAGANLSVDYGRPAKRGREIFGALVPWNQIWRTGADRATHFSTDRDLVIGGTPVPAGEYTLFTIPGPEMWTLIINRRTDITGTAHDPAHDLARVPMRTRALPEVVEDFTIRIEPQESGGVLRLQWDQTEVYVPITVGRVTKG